MLVIISDLHLTDGTSGETIHAGAFRIFRDRLRDLAYKASKRTRGYNPIKEFDLLLLGDILDVIRSNKWSDDGQVRPWHDPQSQPYIDKIKQINQATLEQNKKAFAIFRELANGTAITLPPAKNGQPLGNMWDITAKNRVPVKVNIHYMVGNHDWFYHLPGNSYDEIRQTVVDTLGLAQPADQPFPHDPAESTLLPDIYRQHKVFARHGDIFDPVNYEAKHGRDASSLGDAIVIELINRFPVVVRERLGNRLPIQFVEGLKELDNVRPNIVTPIWINGLMRRCYLEGQSADNIHAIWNELADQFLNLDFVRTRDGLSPFDQVDKLQFMLKFSKTLSFQELSKVMGWLINKPSLFSSVINTLERSSYAEEATKEVNFQDKSAHYVIYGHTHHQEQIPLDVSRTRGRIVNQTYFNSGTWRQVHNLVTTKPQEEEFIGHYVMTYLAFFKEDERKGRPFEQWSGMLSP